MANELEVAEQSAEKVAFGIASTMKQADELTRHLAFPKTNDSAALDVYRAAYAEADVAYNELHRAWSHGEEQRLQLTKPLNEVLRKINAAFKGKLDPIETMKRALKSRMESASRDELFWKRAEEDRKRRAEQKRLEDEALARAQKAADQGQNVVADKILERPIVTPKIEVETASGSAQSSMTVKWSARVWDKMAFIKAVAAGTIDSDFVTIDEQRIKNMARAAKGKIPAMPGIEVFEDVQIGAGGRR